MRCLTINTDASYHPEHKVGGYAFYIICDLFKIQKGGMFKVHPKNAMEAEMMCMANAVHIVLHQKELPEFDLVIINSDCLFAFQRIGKKSNSPIGKKIALLLRDLRKRTNFKKYELRHVKAHSGVQDKRSFVNEWCDKEAKKWMRLSIPNNNV